ncbi:hypothetical protein [Aeromicrobium sp. A1-2]|uniref:MFS transporter small subunit n=1 Tax=Aeromicrobium sp. A1-2 TaxID=2107713 RepID=UPI0020B1537A|nr:hypothetical protein [Aeromicrobium sp. A1-2]
MIGSTPSRSPTSTVGAIHGRLLTAWAAAGVAGPLIVNRILDAQGKPGRLTAADYRPALLMMVGVLMVGFVANLAIRPVDERFHEPRIDATSTAETQAAAADHDVPVAPAGPLIVSAWVLVAIPLAYGIYETVVKAADLFWSAARLMTGVSVADAPCAPRPLRWRPGCRTTR